MKRRTLDDEWPDFESTRTEDDGVGVVGRCGRTRSSGDSGTASERLEVAESMEQGTGSSSSRVRGRWRQALSLRPRANFTLLHLSPILSSGRNTPGKRTDKVSRYAVTGSRSSSKRGRGRRMRKATKESSRRGSDGGNVGLEGK